MTKMQNGLELDSGERIEFDDLTTQDSAAYTKAESDALFRGRRLNWNGPISMWQNGTSFTDPDITKYLADNFRIRIADSDSAALDVAQSTLSPVGTAGSSLRITCTTAQTSFTGNQSRGILTAVEGYDYEPIYADGYMTLSFWVFADLAGTSCVCFQNDDYSRSYIVEYTINSATTWEYKTMTIPTNSYGFGLTNQASLLVSWTLSCGSNKQTTAGAWQTGDYRATSNQVNHLGAVNRRFYLKNIQVEKGQTATEFEYLRGHIERAWALRYYEAFGFSFYGFMTSSNSNYRDWVITYSQIKRTSGNTIVITGGNASPTINNNTRKRLVMNYNSSDTTTSRYFTLLKCFSTLLECTT